MSLPGSRCSPGFTECILRIRKSDSAVSSGRASTVALVLNSHYPHLGIAGR